MPVHPVLLLIADFQQSSWLFYRLCVLLLLLLYFMMITLFRFDVIILVFAFCFLVRVEEGLVAVVRCSTMHG